MRNSKDNKEFETKVVAINKEEIIAKLRKFGAKETPEYLMRKVIFDIESSNVEFIRVREENAVSKMAYKYKDVSSSTIGRTTEIEVTISNFDTTVEILKKIPFKRILYQESKMHQFHFDDIEFSIATWPKIPPYLEIEANSIEKVAKGLELLDLTGKDSGDLDIKTLYHEIGLDLNEIADLRF